MFDVCSYVQVSLLRLELCRSLFCGWVLWNMDLFCAGLSFAVGLFGRLGTLGNGFGRSLVFAGGPGGFLSTGSGGPSWVPLLSVLRHLLD